MIEFKELKEFVAEIEKQLLEIKYGYSSSRDALKRYAEVDAYIKQNADKIYSYFDNVYIFQEWSYYKLNNPKTQGTWVGLRYFHYLNNKAPVDVMYDFLREFVKKH